MSTHCYLARGCFRSDWHSFHLHVLMNALLGGGEAAVPADHELLAWAGAVQAGPQDFQRSQPWTSMMCWVLTGSPALTQVPQGDALHTGGPPAADGASRARGAPPGPSSAAGTPRPAAPAARSASTCSSRVLPACRSMLS